MKIFLACLYSTLFVLYCVIFYSDDIAHCADTVRNLQMQINKFSKFCNEFKLSINMGKTEIIVCRNAGPLRKK